MALKDVNLLLLRWADKTVYCQVSLPNAGSDVSKLDDCVKDGTLTLEERSVLVAITGKLADRALNLQASSEPPAPPPDPNAVPLKEFNCELCGGSHCMHNPDIEVAVEPEVDHEVETEVVIEDEPTDPESE